LPWSLELQIVELHLNYITIKLRGFPAFGKYRYLARFALALMHHFDRLAPGRTLRIIELTAALDPLRLPEMPTGASNTTGVLRAP
jgi:hypothetical protein